MTGRYDVSISKDPISAQFGQNEIIQKHKAQMLRANYKVERMSESLVQPIAASNILAAVASCQALMSGSLGQFFGKVTVTAHCICSPHQEILPHNLQNAVSP